ncbi:hypothetical protein CERZMDRAFT_11389, partial [Cercospora zeae-maydis SCOH1-5]
SPPLSPVRQYMVSPLDTSPSRSSYREHLRRRTSSFSSNHDRSPTTPKSRHRFSNASQLSADYPGSPVDEGGGLEGTGNLADELDQLDEGEDDFEEGATEEGLHTDGEEQSRDSGIDVSYAQSAKSSNPPSAHHMRNFSKPFGGGEDERSPIEARAAEQQDEVNIEDRFSSELEDLMNTIARMTSYTSTSEDPLVPRTIVQLQDLGNQTNLEAGAHRLTTGTNSMTSHLSTQAKAMQTTTQSLFPVVAGFAAPLDAALIDETLPLMDVLKESIPQPDIVVVQKLQKLERETMEVIATLSQLTDTLQMGKQITNSAARHLRTTQTMVVELRRERERAESARVDLQQNGWGEKIQDRWCGGQCKDIISGFEARCDTLRGELE